MNGGDGCCGRGYFCDWGVVGAVREPPLRVGRRERLGWGCCGEFRASPCSLRSRPPSRGEGGEGWSIGLRLTYIVTKDIFVLRGTELS